MSIAVNNIAPTSISSEQVINNKEGNTHKIIGKFQNEISQIISQNNDELLRLIIIKLEEYIISQSKEDTKGNKTLHTFSISDEGKETIYKICLFPEIQQLLQIELQKEFNFKKAILLIERYNKHINAINGESSNPFEQYTVSSDDIQVAITELQSMNTDDIEHRSVKLFLGETQTGISSVLKDKENFDAKQTGIQLALERLTLENFNSFIKKVTQKKSGGNANSIESNLYEIIQKATEKINKINLDKVHTIEEKHPVTVEEAKVSDKTDNISPFQKYKKVIIGALSAGIISAGVGVFISKNDSSETKSDQFENMQNIDIKSLLNSKIQDIFHKASQTTNSMGELNGKVGITLKQTIDAINITQQTRFNIRTAVTGMGEMIVETFDNRSGINYYYPLSLDQKTRSRFEKNTIPLVRKNITERISEFKNRNRVNNYNIAIPFYQAGNPHTQNLSDFITSYPNLGKGIKIDHTIKYEYEQNLLHIIIFNQRHSINLTTQQLID